MLIVVSMRLAVKRKISYICDLFSENIQFIYYKIYLITRLKNVLVIFVKDTWDSRTYCTNPINHDMDRITIWFHSDTNALLTSLILVAWNLQNIFCRKSKFIIIKKW